jgi:hypothetical protein
MVVGSALDFSFIFLYLNWQLFLLLLSNPLNTTTELKPFGFSVLSIVYGQNLFWSLVLV